LRDDTELSAIISDADLERELTVVQSAAVGDAAGVFGPGSVTWRLDREALVFLGAGRALLLQLAHPWVATAIAEHSRTLSDPVGRFQRTFNITLTMAFGTTGQALAAARRLHRRHAAISGNLTEKAGVFPAGSPYRANDVVALRWVWATLVDTAPLAYELACPLLPPADRERYYAEMRIFAALFGIPQSALPQSWAGFARYMDEMPGSDNLAVNCTARRLAGELFGGQRWPMPQWYHALTASLLPPRLRQDFGLSWGPIEQRGVARAMKVLRRIYPCIPARLRHVAPYQEALARLAGRERPGIMTRALNRLWIGQSSMAGAAK
jgi:uncharacterized protein (DUF2236 family)